MAHMRGVKAATGLAAGASAGDEGVPPAEATAEATAEHGPLSGYPDHDHAAAAEKIVVQHEHEEHHISIEHLDSISMPEHVATSIKHSAHSLSSEVKKVSISPAVVAEMFGTLGMFGTWRFTVCSRTDGRRQQVVASEETGRRSGSKF